MENSLSAQRSVSETVCQPVGRSNSQQLFLAPMEDVTDPAFRSLCKRYGADRVYTEFVNADALVRDVASTTRKLTIHDAERPVAIQIYGREPEAMAEAARIVEQAHPDFIDINFGCPVKKVAGKGAGAGLLKDVPKMLDIARAVVNAVHTPVTAKTRLGWDDKDLIPRVNPLGIQGIWETGNPEYFVVSLAEALQDCGITELAIHGRTRSQMYRGEADWTLIGEVKNNPRIHIPIIGNGDVCTPARAKECFDRYGVDAVMIGRASFGAPWLFAEIKEALGNHHLDMTISRYDDMTESSLPFREGSGVGFLPRSMADKVAVLKEHVLASIAWCDNDERKGIIHSRRHFAASPVFKGLPDFRQTRIALLRADTVADVFTIMDDIVTRWGSPELQNSSNPELQ
ncbi:MAG: tRNA-dihydrouridine synthase family protein [Paludibacteraceae bacterium]|nr:tRNA-dihydrouridine synthase family protein [Paludibacteraceae bacterium]